MTPYMQGLFTGMVCYAVFSFIADCVMHTWRALRPNAPTAPPQPADARRQP